jgi:biopolymer transport protein TolQ
MSFSMPKFFQLVEEAPVPGVEAPAVPVTEHIHDFSLYDMIFSSSPVVQGVLVLLVVMSVWTWGIVIYKYKAMRRAKAQSDRFEEVFWSSKNLAQISDVARELVESPVAQVFSAGHHELTAVLGSKTLNAEHAPLENIDRALRKAKMEEVTRLEKGTTMLATTASAAPFIGLFGTVWGIMNAFIGLSHVKSSSIQAVAPGISEALIATAIGLAAAIPAAIFYNVFMQQLKIMSRSMDSFSAEFLNIARRHFLK